MSVWMFVSLRNSFCRALILGILVIGISTINLYAQAKGIVIYKQNSAIPDSASIVFEFTSIRSMGEVTRYTTLNGQQVELTQFQPHRSIDYLDLMSCSITDPAQLGPIENANRSYHALITTYPRATIFLKPFIQTTEEIIRRVKGGEVLFNGAFMMKSEYEILIKGDESSAEKQLEISKQKRHLAAEQARRLDMETRRHKR